MSSKLYRSKNDEVISGVCGGLADYFNVDATILRVLWVLVAFFEPDIGILGYLVCSIIIPTRSKVFKNYTDTNYNDVHEDSTHNDSNETSLTTSTSKSTNSRKNSKSSISLGVALILIGGLFVLKRFYSWINFDELWPVLLILAGIFIIVKKD